MSVARKKVANLPVPNTGMTARTDNQIVLLFRFCIIQTGKLLIVFVLVRSITVIKLPLDSMSNI